MKSNFLEDSLLTPASGTGVFLSRNAKQVIKTISFRDDPFWLRKPKWYDKLQKDQDLTDEEKALKKEGRGGSDSGGGDSGNFPDDLLNEYFNKKRELNKKETKQLLKYGFLTKHARDSNNGGSNRVISMPYEMAGVYKIQLDRMIPLILRRLNSDDDSEIGFTIYRKRNGQYSLGRKIVGNGNSVDIQIADTGDSVTGFFHTHLDGEFYSGDDIWALFNYLKNDADDMYDAIKDGFFLILKNTLGLHTLIVEDFRRFINKLTDALELTGFESKEEFLLKFYNWMENSSGTYKDRLLELLSDAGIIYLYD